MVEKKVDQGQEKPPSETDIEKAKKEIEKAALENEKLRLELENLHSLRELNQAAAIKTVASGLIPAPSAKPLEGTMGVGEKAGFLTDIIAYRAMEDVASEITAEIATFPGKTILIVHDQKVFSRSAIYCDIVSHIQNFITIVNDQVEENNKIPGIKPKKEIEAPPSKSVRFPPAVIAGASVALDTATKVVEYLRSNYTLTRRDITIKDEALVALLAGKIIKKGFHVYIENFFMMNDDFCKNSYIVTLINSLMMKCISLDATIPLLKKPGDEELPPQNKLAIEKSTAILKTVKEYLQGIKASDKEDILPELVVAMKQEYIRSMNPDYLLYAGVISLGGDVLTKQSLIPGLSYYGHIAGCTANYLLGDRDGKIISANTISTAKSYFFKPGKMISEGVRTIRI